MNKVLSVLFLICTLLICANASGQKVNYKGGYFQKSGNKWYEYRPQEKKGIHNSFNQVSEDANWWVLDNGRCQVAIPKNPGKNNILIKMPGGQWQFKYTATTISGYSSGSSKSGTSSNNSSDDLIKIHNTQTGWERIYPIYSEVSKFDNKLETVETLSDCTLHVSYLKQFRCDQPPMLQIAIVSSDGHTSPICGIYYLNSSSAYYKGTEDYEGRKMIMNGLLCRETLPIQFQWFLKSSDLHVGRIAFFEFRSHDFNSLNRGYDFYLMPSQLTDLHNAIMQVLRQYNIRGI